MCTLFSACIEIIQNCFNEWITFMNYLIWTMLLCPFKEMYEWTIPLKYILQWGQFTQQWKFCHHLLTLMMLHIHKTSLLLVKWRYLKQLSHPYSVLYTILFYSILFYSILFYSILFYWSWTSGRDSSGPTLLLWSVGPLWRGWASSSTSV